MKHVDAKNDDRMSSRFFTTADSKAENLVLPLPAVWWSRPYEYAWAATFAEGADRVLDAACGVEHPFKFYLLDHCGQVDACDLDERILCRQATLEGLRNTYGDDAVESLPERYLTGIRYVRASVTHLPYPEGIFDRVFCVSVLEHLNDYFNRNARSSVPKLFRFAFSRDIYRALREFRRVLKDGGFIVLTFDYPDINLDYLARIADELGLAPAGPVIRDIPPDALYFEPLNIHCFRMVLKKTHNAKDRGTET